MYHVFIRQESIGSPGYSVQGYRTTCNIPSYYWSYEKRPISECPGVGKASLHVTRVRYRLRQDKWLVSSGLDCWLVGLWIYSFIQSFIDFLTDFVTDVTGW